MRLEVTDRYWLLLLRQVPTESSRELLYGYDNAVAANGGNLPWTEAAAAASSPV